MTHAELAVRYATRSMGRADYHAARRAGEPLPKQQPLAGTLFWMQASRRAMVASELRCLRVGLHRPGAARKWLRPLAPFTDCKLPGGAA